MKNTQTGKEKKINDISSDLQDFITDTEPKDKELFLSYVSDIICAFDTDIAIRVLEQFGELGEEQAKFLKELSESERTEHKFNCQDEPNWNGSGKSYFKE
tara:strand:- start:3523 stop:3822 length:300 start_codon:yes stop_codon:yes gene_type:complete